MTHIKDLRNRQHTKRVRSKRIKLKKYALTFDPLSSIFTLILTIGDEYSIRYVVRYNSEQSLKSATVYWTPFNIVKMCVPCAAVAEVQSAQDQALAHLLALETAQDTHTVTR